MKILILDSTTRNTGANITNRNLAGAPPPEDYLDHSDDLYNIFQKYIGREVPVEYIFVHIAEDTEYDRAYISLRNHENFNKALRWAKKCGDVDIIYGGITFYNKGHKGTDRKKFIKLAAETERLVKELKIPVICPAENSQDERDNFKFIEVSPSPKSRNIYYISSKKNAWGGTYTMLGMEGTKKQKREEYTSRLSAMFICQIINMPIDV